MIDWSKFRGYQLDGISALWQYFRDYTGNPLIAMPTGSGKSWVIAGFVASVFMQFSNQRVLACTHDEVLIKQNLAKLLHIWPTAPAGVYSAGLKRREHLAPITFCSIQSVHKKAELFGHVDLLIIDEAHLVSPRNETMYQRFIEALRARNPFLKVIGLSATCYRLGLGMLTEGQIFTHVCYDLTTPAEYNRLVASGYIAPLIARKTSYQIDVSDVSMRGGEYNESEQQQAVNREDVTRKVLQEIIRAVPDRNRWLLFATGTDHCDSVARMLQSYGIPTVPIHSNCKEADENYELFSAGKVRAAVAMNSMTTGVDIPEIDFIGMLRHTASASLWVQMLGRGTRPAPWANKTNCLVLDFTSNTRRLGPINDPVVPTKPSKKKKRSGDAPVKDCPKCGVYNHASARYCGGEPVPTMYGCGYLFPPKVNIQLESSGLEVMRLQEEELIVKLFEVSNVTYHENESRNPEKPNSMRVTYFCQGEKAVEKYREFICFEHGGAARAHAVRWWNERMPQGPIIGIPNSIKDALALRSHLKIPKQIRVWMKKPYPEILSYVY